MGKLATMVAKGVKEPGRPQTGYHAFITSIYGTGTFSMDHLVIWLRAKVSADPQPAPKRAQR